MSAVRHALVLPAIALAGLAFAQDRDPRKELDPLAQALDRELRRVSRASTLWGPGDACRAYRIDGMGAMFVVAPRALPPRSPLVFWLPAGDPEALERAAQEAEARLARAGSPEERARLERRLKAFRAALAARREQQRRRDARERERLAAREAEAGRRREEAVSASDTPDEPLPRNVEEQLRAFQEEAESFRRQAEEAFEEMSEQMRRQFEGAVIVPDRPGLQILIPDVAVSSELPWDVWFDDGAGDERGADRIVQDVREAVTSVLESRGAGLRTVRPDEQVVVAVDFLRPGTLLARRGPERTLLVRVRKKDLEDREAGRLSADAFRKKIEYVQY
jgi:hypothetical protein